MSTYIMLLQFQLQQRYRTSYGSNIKKLRKLQWNFACQVADIMRPMRNVLFACTQVCLLFYYYLAECYLQNWVINSNEFKICGTIYSLNWNLDQEHCQLDSFLSFIIKIITANIFH